MFIQLSKCVSCCRFLAVRSVSGEESEPSLSRRLVQLVQEVLSAAQDPQLENLGVFFNRKAITSWSHLFKTTSELVNFLICGLRGSLSHPRIWKKDEEGYD